MRESKGERVALILIVARMPKCWDHFKDNVWLELINNSFVENYTG